jgi:two-component system sensor kinase FixL
VETREKRLFGGRLELTGMRAGGTDPVELAVGQVRGEPYLMCGAVRDLIDAKRAKGDLHRLEDEKSALGHVATTVAECATAIQELQLGDVGSARALDGGTERMEAWA